MLSCLFLAALLPPAGKGLTYLLSYVLCFCVGQGCCQLNGNDSDVVSFWFLIALVMN